MPALTQFIVVALSYLGVVAAVRWGISEDRSDTSPMPDGYLLIGDGRPFHRVPVCNLHRQRGRHRAY